MRLYFLSFLHSYFWRIPSKITLPHWNMELLPFFKWEKTYWNSLFGLVACKIRKLFRSHSVTRERKNTRVQVTHTHKRIGEVQSYNSQWTQDMIGQFANKLIGTTLVSKILKEGEKWISLLKEKCERTRIRLAMTELRCCNSCILTSNFRCWWCYKIWGWFGCVGHY